MDRGRQPVAPCGLLAPPEERAEFTPEPQQLGVDGVVQLLAVRRHPFLLIQGMPLG
jgi:hypothetical protein